jgi:hypothetical protein
VTLWAGVSVIILGLIVYWGYGPIRHYDTGLYHHQIIKWIQYYPLPRGIANLHGRFGFNSWYTALAAVVEPISPITPTPAYFIGGGSSFFYYVSIARVGYELLSEERRRASVSSWFLVWSLIIPIIRTPGFWTSVSTDLPATQIGILAVYLCLEYFENEETNRRKALLVLLAVVVSFGVTVKLSAIIWTLLFVIVLYAHVKNHGTDKSVLMAFILVALYGSIYILRGYWLSGYPFYPSTLFSAPQLSWAVSPGQALGEKVAITGWARSPGAGYREAMENWSWLGGWIRRSTELLFRVGFLFVGSVTLFRVAGGRLLQLRWSYRRTIAITGLIGIAFWFVNAPTERFGEAYIYSIPLLLSSTALSRVMRKPERRRRYGVLVTALAVLLLFGFRPLIRYNDNVQPNVLIDAAFNMPSVDVVERLNRWGQTIYVPESGDQTWDAPLPATPYFYEGLRIRMNPNGEIRAFVGPHKTEANN